MGTTTMPQGQATYMAPKSDWAWLLSEQRKLYRRSWEQPEYVFEKLWGLVTDPRNLRMAVTRVASNRGRRTGGVDRVTVRMVVRDGVDTFVEAVRAELRSGSYRPAPVRRVLIPKPGQLGKFRPLGIPTVKDRVVQSAVKNILEPIFEAGFYPNSYGFRPGRVGSRGAGAPSDAPASTRKSARAAAPVPMGNRRRHQGMLRQHRPSRR